MLADHAIRITEVDPMHSRDAVISAIGMLGLSRVMMHRGSRWSEIVYAHCLAESLSTGQAPTPVDGEHIVQNLGFDPMEPVDLDFYLHRRQDGGITIAYGGSWEELFAEPVESVLTGSKPGVAHELWPDGECDHVHVRVPGGMVPATCNAKEAAISALFSWYAANDLAVGASGPEGIDPMDMTRMRGRARRAVDRNPDLVPPLEGVLNGEWEGFTSQQVLSAIEEEV